MRLRELRREPGTLFWVFGFPILMSIALGLAFRNTGPEPVRVGVLPGVADDVKRALVAGGVQVQPLDEAAARDELRAGRVALVLVPPAAAGAAPTLPLRSTCVPSRASGAPSSTTCCSGPPAAAIRAPSATSRARARRALHRLSGSRA